ncbi:MAG: translation initiation factor [bacterium]
MSKKSAIKVDTSGSQMGLQNPFAAFDSNVFPEALLPLPAPTAVLPVQPKPSRKGRVVLRRETAHRGGKTVVVVSAFAPEIHQNEIEKLARELRKHCGCGGAVKEREIEIQGDQPIRVREFLTTAGFQVAGVTVFFLMATMEILLHHLSYGWR